MNYSIGEVSKKTGISISTLRYYDKEGLFPSIQRSSGIRVFTDNEMSTIKVIECLKVSGLSIKEIKQFLDWCQEGDASLQKRHDMFYNRLDVMEKRVAELQNTINLIKFKCWYYDLALSAGTEEVPKNINEEDIPEELRNYKI